MRILIFIMAGFDMAVMASLCGAQADAPVLDIQEWEVPYKNTRPRDPFAQNADSVWFVGQAGGYLARLDVATGTYEKVDLKSGSAPHNLIVGSDGLVWFAGNRTALIGSYNPATGEIIEYAMPDPGARDPHTLIFDQAEEHIWFTVQGGNYIGRLRLSDGNIELLASATENSRPYGITLAPDGVVWVALFGTNKLARVNPETLELNEVVLPREEARPRRLEVTADGSVWYVDYNKSRLGMYNPANGTITEYLMPQGEAARPYGMASDAGGNLWMVASGVHPNIFIGFNPKKQIFFGETPIPSGGGTIRHMHYHQASGAVWFGTDTNYVGRVIVESGAD